MVDHGPTENDVEERERFWEDIDRVFDRNSNGYALFVLGDMNVWVGDMMRGPFLVSLVFRGK